MKRILVTGADGFIGSHLTELLLKEGHQVLALSRYNSFNSWGWLDDIEERESLTVITGDICDPHFCIQMTREIDVIYHLAALIAIPFSYNAPNLYIETNVTGTLNICQAARMNGNIRLIHTSTSEVYGTARYVPIDEQHPKQPQSPYSASKIGADAVAMSFFHSYGLPVTVARPFNTYGPRQSARAFIPTIITQIASGAKIVKVGDLSPKRDLNFVNDTCEGLVALGNSEGTIGKEINICSNTEISMSEVMDHIKDIMGSDVQFQTDQERLRPESSEVYQLFGSNSLMFEITGFKPKISLKIGLKRTCDWFQIPENLIKYKPGIYNL